MLNGRIVSGSGDRTARVWDLSIPADKSGFGGFTIPWREWDFSIPEFQSGRIVLLHGHTDWVHSVAVMPDSRIVSGSEDRIVRVWNPAIPAGEEGHMVVLRGHTGSVTSVAVMSDGRIVSGSSDNTVRVWPSEQYFREKVARTQDRRDYVMDGPGVYEILFPRRVAVDNAVASAAQVTELAGDVGGAEDLISAVEAAAALDQSDNQGSGADVDLAIEQPTAEMAVAAGDRAGADDAQPAFEAPGDFIAKFNNLTQSNEIIEALSGWLSANFILNGEALELIDDSNIDLLSVQAKQIIERLQSRDVSTDIMRQQVGVFDQRLSVSALIRKLRPCCCSAKVRDHQGGGGRADAPVVSAAEAAAALAQGDNPSGGADVDLAIEQTAAELAVAAGDRAGADDAQSAVEASLAPRVRDHQGGGAPAALADRKESDDDNFGDIDLDSLDFAETAGLDPDDRGWGSQR